MCGRSEPGRVAGRGARGERGGRPDAVSRTGHVAAGGVCLLLEGRGALVVSDGGTRRTAHGARDTALVARHRPSNVAGRGAHDERGGQRARGRAWRGNMRWGAPRGGRAGAARGARGSTWGARRTERRRASACWHTHKFVCIRIRIHIYVYVYVYVYIYTPLWQPSCNPLASLWQPYPKPSHKPSHNPLATLWQPPYNPVATLVQPSDNLIKKPARKPSHNPLATSI